MAENTNQLKIIIKTLKAQRHEITVNLEGSVADLKKQIETDLKLGDASSMKLIHHGKILKNDQILNSCGLKENDFVVLMTAKKKKQSKPAPVAQPTEAQPTQPPPSQPPASSATNSAPSTSAAPAQSAAP